MTTAAAERPTLVGVRERKSTGIPTSGLGLIVGHPKSGKTRLVTSFPNSYTMELEKNGADRIGGARIHDIDNLDTFGTVLEMVMNEPSIRTVIIDTVDQLAVWQMDDIARRAGLAHISERKAGVDGWALWGELRSRFEGLVEYFKSSGKLVLLVAHCKPPEKDDRGRVITPAGINVPGKSGDYLAAQAEFIGYVSRKVVGGKSVHFLSFQAESDMALWSSRIEELNDQTIELSRTNPYASFSAVFDAKDVAPKTELKKARK